MRVGVDLVDARLRPVVLNSGRLRRARSGAGGNDGRAGLVPNGLAFFLAVGRERLNVAGRPALAFLSAGHFLSRIYGQYSVGGRSVGG
jgi:hypothetical protein